MSFTCQLCGECCSTMGEIICIREEIGPFRYRIGYSSTCEEQEVVVDPDKRVLFQSHPHSQKISLACPFLCERGEGKRICTVHQSRPELCRQYSCYRILILSSDGTRAGKVRAGSRYFTATNPDLYELWGRECRTLEIPDDRVWEDTVERILKRAGYTVLR